MSVLSVTPVKHVIFAASKFAILEYSEIAIFQNCI